MKYLLQNLILWYLLGLTFLAVLSYSANRFTPFEYNLEITKHQYQDVCVGDSLQRVTTAREVLPVQGFNATLKGELFKLENGVFVETTVRRYAEYSYQPNEGQEFQFETAWVDQAYEPPTPYVFTEPGIYAAGELITITPYPLVTKTKYFPASDHVFAVVDCAYDGADT